MNIADLALGRALRLPPPTTGYRVHRRLSVPMRDGVDLHADHYEPEGDARGTVLVRGPYGRSFPFSVIYARIYAARGYHVVFQSVRGTFGSGGRFVPMVHEVDDAADTAAWLREQPWFTGSFGTIGLSYLGFTQWALLSDPPPELVAAAVSVGPHDLHQSSWGTGSFALNDFLGWSDLVANQETSPAGRVAFQLRAARRLASAVDGLPLGEAGRALLQQESHWYESWLEHPEPDDFWARMRMTEALQRCEIPVLLLGGWQDVFIDQTIAQYRQLHGRGVDVAMTIGPWTHEQMVTSAVGVTAAETLAWLDTHLAGRPPARDTPVRVYLTGARAAWVNLPDWPPVTTEVTYHLQPAGGLATARPVAGGSMSFRFDPADPTPTVGGRLLSRRAGYRDDSALAGRADVLSFTSVPLDGDLLVCGAPVIELDYRSDNPHFDVFVRLSEVDERGRSRTVSDGYRRFTTHPDGPIRLDLDPIAHRFAAGSRLRMLVAGGCHPRFARNLGTGEPVLTARRTATSVHSVMIGPDGVSGIRLPVATEPIGNRAGRSR